MTMGGWSDVFMMASWEQGVARGQEDSDRHAVASPQSGARG